MEQHLDEGLIRQPAPARQLLRRLDVAHGEADRHRLGSAASWRKPPQPAFLLRLEEELGDDGGVGVPPLGLFLFRPEFRDRRMAIKLYLVRTVYIQRRSESTRGAASGSGDAHVFQRGGLAG